MIVTPPPAEPTPAGHGTPLGLVDVLPSVARSLGVDLPDAAGRLPLPPAQRAVVVLVDGLGLELLRRRAGHAPTLRRALATAPDLECGYPSTTATSMGTFGTGTLPGAHGLVGYEVLVPEHDRLMNELAWDDDVDPFRWQPGPTRFEQAADQGVAVTRIGPHFFDGSGLTNAALRGGRFVGAMGLDARVEAAARAARDGDRALVYLYWGDLDKTGHVFGCDSPQWTAELERVDEALATLARTVPRGTRVYVTADHGMVDIPFAARLDLVDEPHLRAGVRHVGGEPRSPQVYCEPGAAERVARVWCERLGVGATVRTREEVVAAGVFGGVRPEVLARIGDLVVTFTDGRAVVDSQRMRAELIALRGLHGSTTRDETAIPFLDISR